MALSYYTNLAQPEFCIPPELLNFHDNYLLSDTSIDPLFDQTTYIYPENTFNIPSPPPQTALLPPPSPPQTFDTYTYTYPKRIKSQENVYYYPDSVNAYYDHDVFVPNPPLLPEFSIPLPEFQPTSTILPSVFSCGSNSTSTITPATSITSSTNVIDNNISTTSIVKNKSGLSAQSVAARLRRRKITEKTQELGKLIPGGQKMNTAEMFQAASKYIKFLQAQVGMLELMGSFHHNQVTFLKK